MLSSLSFDIDYHDDPDWAPIKTMDGAFAETAPLPEPLVVGIAPGFRNLTCPDGRRPWSRMGPMADGSTGLDKARMDEHDERCGELVRAMAPARRAGVGE